MSDTEMPCFFSDRVAFVILNTTILKDDLASCKYKKKVWINRLACPPSMMQQYIAYAPMAYNRGQNSSPPKELSLSLLERHFEMLCRKTIGVISWFELLS